MKNKYKKLDALFSKYIRLVHSQDGLCRCCTCGKLYPVAKIQCGHFMSRRHLSTRWDEQNCAPQCVSCNIFREGMHYEFGLWIEKKYGKGTAEKLKIRSGNRFNGFIPQLEKYYEGKLKEITG